MRVLVCGTREELNLGQQQRVYDVLDALLDRWETNMDLLIHGGADGVDSCAHRWANFRGIQTASFEISRSVWRRLGKKAGPLRNRVMLELQPSLVVAFPGGIGTADMCRAAKPVCPIEEYVWRDGS